MIRLGIIGYGYWGPNLARNFSATNGCFLVGISDARQDRLALAKSKYPNVELFDNALSLIGSSTIDAVVISTPVATHFELAKLALNAGKHVLLEKPMTTSVNEALELIELALCKRLTLMVDHTFIYTGAVNKIKDLIFSEAIGRLRYFDSTRVNLGLFQSDSNVLWDLAPHDLSILNYITHQKPVSVNATGKSHTGNGIENIGYLTLHYEDDFIAHIGCSWSSPVKVRKILIGGDSKMIVYDDIEPTDKIRVYDSGYLLKKTEDEKSQLLIDYRIGDIHIPKLTTTEALSVMATDFINSIEHSSIPKSNCSIGLSVVNTLESAHESIKNDGKRVHLKIIEK
jgi:predicted dehydrogenase